MDAHICRAAYLLRLQLHVGMQAEAENRLVATIFHSHITLHLNIAGFGGRYLTGNEQTADGARLAPRSAERVYLVVKVMSCQSDDFMKKKSEKTAPAN